MASILKKIVDRFNTKGQKIPSEKVSVAAFGKHPGWDDHIDDIGLETDVLVAVKRILYIQGIGSNIDAGSWDKLEENQLVEKFGHAFVWCINGDVVVGRLWSSQDGKGRKSYPMFVCAQCSQLPLPWVFENILPRFEGIEQACTNTTSADDVRKIIEDARNKFRQLALQCKPVPGSAVECSNLLARLAELPEMGPDRQGLYRVMYYIDREVVQAASGTSKDRDLRPALVRVPNSSPGVQENVLLWINFLLAKFGPNTNILVFMPLWDPWIDIIIGEPTDLHLFCLRASISVVPLTNSIPYSIDSEFVDQINQLIDKQQSV